MRRGSSTDPTKPASLEEIAQMRIGIDQSSAELDVEFAHVNRDEALGKHTSWEAEFCKMPAREQIPDFCVGESKVLPLGLLSTVIDPYLNRNFFRDLAKYEHARRLFKPMRLVVRNVGQVVEKNVRVELTIGERDEELVLATRDLPERPKHRHEILSAAALNVVPTAISYPGEVCIERDDKHFHLAMDCNDLQPGRRVWSDVINIAKKRSGDIPLSGLVFADNLPQPKIFALRGSVVVRETVMTVEELCSLSDLITEDD